jgi:hypothetical protein
MDGYRQIKVSGYLMKLRKKFSLFPDTENLKNFNDSGVDQYFSGYKQGIIWFLHLG